MHLLVIEDERALCETIVRSLRRLAYSVDYCYDGEKALELLGVECYDLVLLDLNLPKKDGMTVLRTLRQIQIQQHQIVALHAQKRQRLFPIIAVVHAVGQPPQAADDGFAQGAFVFNNQKVHESPPFTFLHVHIVLNYSKNR